MARVRNSLTDFTPLPINFNIIGDWSLVSVTDEASFISYLENILILQDVTVESFSLVGNDLKCYMSATATTSLEFVFDITDVLAIGDIQGITELSFEGNLITDFNPVVPLPSTLEILRLGNNQIVDFDPDIALPSSLKQLLLSSNQIVTFEPSVALSNSLEYLSLDANQIVTFAPNFALPSSLEELILGGNPLTTFNPSVALPNSLINLNLVNCAIVTFNPSLPLPSSLETLSLNGNDIVIFNPSLSLPISLTLINLSVNAMTTAGYTASETWANLQPAFTNSCDVAFQANVNSVSGTNLQAILLTKNCNVQI
jgi:Leucine-rich repeat (LRR) protein